MRAAVSALTKTFVLITKCADIVYESCLYLARPTLSSRSTSQTCEWRIEEKLSGNSGGACKPVGVFSDILVRLVRPSCGVKMPSLILPPVTTFRPGVDFVSQLRYVGDISATYQPFYFAHKGWKLSVQAGFRTASAFRVEDGPGAVTIEYPFWGARNGAILFSIGVERRVRERTLFPKELATHFEVALLDSMSSAFILLKELPSRNSNGTPVPTWTLEQDDITCPMIPRSAVQDLLEWLAEAE
jgi:hypothetical protein